MRSLTKFGAAAAFALFLAGGASRAEAPRVVSVTSNSAPGWTPTVEQEQAATTAVRKYLAARDSGRAAEAYAQLDPTDARGVAAADFTRDLEKFNRTAGAVKERRITKLTWTKDPPAAPAPGVYAAFDLVSRFAFVDRHCGYVVVRQAKPGAPFLVMSEESVFMDNATAQGVEKRQSKAAADQLWVRVSATCPNYKAPLPETEGDAIEYPSVAAALAGLHAKPGVTFSEQNGWTIAVDQASLTMWSFAPRGNAAYPAVAKRQVKESNGATTIETSVQCEASKETCDDFLRSFEQLNAQAQGRR